MKLSGIVKKNFGRGKSLGFPTANFDLTEDVETALSSFPGINQRDFYPPEARHLFPVVDDTDNGVVVFSAKDTLKSRRTLTRGPQNTPYYIYADTAMSNISTFRPEWIKELYVHDGENADDDKHFNQGKTRNSFQLIASSF